MITKTAVDIRNHAAGHVKAACDACVVVNFPSTQLHDQGHRDSRRCCHLGCDFNTACIPASFLDCKVPRRVLH